MPPPPRPRPLTPPQSPDTTETPASPPDPPTFRSPATPPDAPAEGDEPLIGDVPVEKLTRVITRTMPEDYPKKCVGDEAELVAR